MSSYILISDVSLTSTANFPWQDRITSLRQKASAVETKLMEQVELLQQQLKEERQMRCVCMLVTSKGSHWHSLAAGYLVSEDFMPLLIAASYNKSSL